MPSQANQQLHFVLFPFMAQGHMIPMMDIARLLAQQGIIVTIVTTPLNAARFKTVIARAINTGLRIQVFELQFPFDKTGLPEGCENFDMLPSFEMSINLFTAACELEQPVEKLFEELDPRPSCIISDMCFPWTVNIANKWRIPRISFNGFCCFCMLCMNNIFASKILETITSESEYFVVPGLPDHIELTKDQLPGPMSKNLEEFHSRILAAEQHSYGIIINTFEELEEAYVKEYKKAKGDNRIWCIGPVSLCNKDALDKAERGNKTSVNEHECLKWLDSWQSGSVVYACLGSISNLIPAQMVELGVGLEASNRPFIWVIRGGDKSREIEKWIEESGFEQRTKGRGLLIRGWAPQVLILSHPAIGGFLTHCGWNSTLEAITAGLPMVTWPLFADQFCNEKLVVQVLKIGVKIGVEVPEKWGEEQKLGVLVKAGDIKRAVDKLMREGEERDERRKRAKELGELAKKATEKGGSSYLNLRSLIQDIMQQSNHEQPA
ncbi:UDP-glycosyltransferase 73C25 [Ricinus communis]|uniref:Glycosyltransferase n=1 Tax=Ricinus communis TaxID=3988 RepID=B9T117_RICCO|nr:UDP-glycosyltransferase 73C25 [Ricinus communis]EEF30444.1 UDP-glucosyltransferase, putative [Ricinus communis]|eukprot:XP_002531930.1 UDP-glycosyltransferase 73C3 [Ricinus communis]